MPKWIVSLSCSLFLLIGHAPAQQESRNASLDDARAAVLGFLSASDYRAIEQYLPDVTRAELREIDPELLNQIFSGGARLLAGRAGSSMSGLEQLAGPPGIRLRFTSNSWLDFQIQNEKVSGATAQFDLSVKYYQDGVEVAESPFASHLSFTMAQENGAWKVQRLVVTSPLNMFDKEILDNLRRSTVARNETTAVVAIRWVNTAELSFAEDNAGTGFTCNVEALAASSLQHVPSDEAAHLRTVLKDGVRNGYRFKFGSCTPSGRTYTVSAEPIRPGRSGNRSFCSDQSGIIYFSLSGSGESCLKEKNPIR